MDKDGQGGERIAKVLARRGVASRRAAEAMIAEGRVAVNGAVIDSPARNVGPQDRIEVDGRPLAEAAPARLWLYHKPVGLVTTEKDEKGRPTVFGALPPELGRVMSVGRLDIGSEGLLLLTNDGGIKRRLELPSTGWLRKYRVRVNGTPADASLDPLRRGITVEGERFQPMEVAIDRQQGANAWLTVGIREGRNREVRRAMQAVGLTVNRLIRISYGPFRLGELAPGAVEEVRPKVLREQLGLERPDPGETHPGKRGSGREASEAEGKPRGGRSGTAKPKPRPGGQRRQEAAAAPGGGRGAKAGGGKVTGAKPPAGKPGAGRGATAGSAKGSIPNAAGGKPGGGRSGAAAGGGGGRGGVVGGKPGVGGAGKPGGGRGGGRPGGGRGGARGRS